MLTQANCKKLRRRSATDTRATKKLAGTQAALVKDAKTNCDRVEAFRGKIKNKNLTNAFYKNILIGSQIKRPSTVTWELDRSLTAWYGYRKKQHRQVRPLRSKHLDVELACAFNFCSKFFRSLDMLIWY